MSKWIKVSERLPEDLQEVYFVIKNPDGNFVVAWGDYYSVDKEFYPHITEIAYSFPASRSEEGPFKIHEVYYWQPMNIPNPPEDE